MEYWPDGKMNPHTNSKYSVMAFQKIRRSQLLYHPRFHRSWVLQLIPKKFGRVESAEYVNCKHDIHLFLLICEREGRKLCNQQCHRCGNKKEQHGRPYGGTKEEMARHRTLRHGSISKERRRQEKDLTYP